MASWEHLAEELDAWGEAGRTATLWWRDDDAMRVTDALERLLGISAATATPVALAVIPRDADDGLRHRLADHPYSAVLQHGWSHDNHAADDQRQEEYGPHRPVAEMIAELAEGWRRIHTFAAAFPVLVAPWNRIDASLIPDLPDAGLAAVSTLGPRPSAEPAPGVRVTNVHVDIMNWDAGRFAGVDAALGQLIGHLAQRRLGEVDADEPTGVMTHHGFHDEDCWRFVGELLERTRSHGAAHWLDAREAFWP